jgi:beta-mannosidase
MMRSNGNILLNGDWLYCKDPENNLSYEKVNRFIEDGSIFNKMTLPVNWQLSGLDNFSGAVWFIRYFDILKESDDIKILRFYGVDYFTDAWLNNIFLGHHEGYFQPFHFIITDVVKAVQNKLIVKVNSPREGPGKIWPDKKKLIKGIFNHHDCRPGAWDLEKGQDKNTGGIWNDVKIEFSKKVFVENIRINSELNDEKNNSIIKIIADYESLFPSIYKDKIVLQIIKSSEIIIEKEICVEFKPGKNQLIISQNIPQPELWWSWDLGEQNLYKLVLRSELLGEIVSNFGIKNVKLDEQQQFYLNRKRLFLRGTNIIPTQWLSELTKEKAASLVGMMKEANINIVRVHAHVNRKEFYNECDKQGILVWQDYALQWTYEESEEFFANAVSQIKDMVKLLHNHPSIAFWCCHNEPGDQIKTLDPLLYNAVQSEDTSRIIRMASNYEEHPYDGWYWGNKEHFASTHMGPLITEFGAQAIPNLHSLEKFIPNKDIYPPNWELWKYHDFQYEQTFLIAGINPGKDNNDFIENSQNYQSELLQTAIDFYRRKKNNGITGIFQFMFIDCWPSITWSVVDYFGEKKKGYYSLMSAFQPVYLSVNLRQKKFLHNSTMHSELWIINDLHESFNDLTLKVSIDDSQVFKIDNLKIDADSIQHINYEKFRINFPETITCGNHTIQFDLINEATKKVISKNYSSFEIVPKLKLIK